MCKTIPCEFCPGVVDFARELVSLGYHILSTGGTAKLLAKEGVPCQEVADYTGFPEMLDGRVKTLNPKIHAGILARRPVAEHMAALEAHGIDPIDIVCVNLYPFEQTIARPDCTLDLAIENIDIGGLSRQTEPKPSFPWQPSSSFCMWHSMDLRSSSTAAL